MCDRVREPPLSNAEEFVTLANATGRAVRIESSLCDVHCATIPIDPHGEPEPHAWSHVHNQPTLRMTRLWANPDGWSWWTNLRGDRLRRRLAATTGGSGPHD